MSHVENLERNRNKGIFLLPHLFTTGALFAGFYSIVAAMNNEFSNAAIMIFIAFLLDGLDGRVARMTGTQSDFGAQFDSLSDMVSFGLAPALLLYTWGISGLGKFGWLAVFFYSAATALRLARFNTVKVSDKRYFTGLPCPAAAAIISGLVWIVTESLEIDGMQYFELLIASSILAITVGLLMVSNIKYHSFKDIDLKGRVPFITVLMIIITYMLIAWDPPIVLFCLFFLYTISGPLLWINSKIFAKNFSENNVSHMNDKKKVS